MSSLSHSPFHSLGETKHKYLFQDNYPLDSITFNLKAAMSSGIGGMGFYKSSYNVVQKQFESEAKLHFPFDRYTFLIGSRGSNEFKFHIDFGRFQLGDYNPTLYTNAKFDSQKLQSLRLGVVLTSAKLYNNLRLIHSGKYIQLHNRFHIKSGKWEYCDITRFPINNKLDIFQWDSQIIYRIKNYEFYFKHISTDKADSQYGSYNLNHGHFGIGVLTALSKFMLGFDSVYKDQTIIATVAGEAEIKENLFMKVKLTNLIKEENYDLKNLDLTIAFKIIQQNVALTLGLHVPLLKIEQKSPKDYPWGVRVDVNV